KVKMITGDHAATAQAIGLRLGLRGGDCGPGDDCPVLTGAELARIDDADLPERAAAVAVFARVSPEQKLRLVTALQRRGEVCAMTGDGVNDAPALKQADIGVAMGVTGTEAAKDAADMILTDDNFATLAAAVEEGRAVYANLVKFIAWTLPTNAGEGLVILAAILFGATLPILPVQILWINMTTAGCLGMMLAFEPREPGIMDRPPRRPDQPILDRAILRRVTLVSLALLVCAFGLFKWEILGGASVEKARTMAVNVFVVVEAFYLFNARSFRRSPFALGLWTNPWVVGGFVLMMALQLVFTYAPFMHALFSSAPVGWLDWAKVLACGAGVSLLIELDKKRNPADV
ncbi:MAG: HAD-IC family P-type ATPase, partial [Pseudodesulfovibrio sp.]